MHQEVNRALVLSPYMTIATAAALTALTLTLTLRGECTDLMPNCAMKLGSTRKKRTPLKNLDSTCSAPAHGAMRHEDTRRTGAKQARMTASTPLPTARTPGRQRQGLGEHAQARGPERPRAGPTPGETGPRRRLRLTHRLLPPRLPAPASCCVLASEHNESSCHHYAACRH